MKRPSFQFYPADWRNNAKLRRCSEAARGAWMDVLCVLHDMDEYGVCRWPLADLARSANVSLKLVKELVDKDVLKGADNNADPYIYTPRHAGKDGESVTLVESNGQPLWYCSRFIRDEHIRQKRGQSSRFDEDNQPPKTIPKLPPKPTLGGLQGDGSTSTSTSTTKLSNTQGISTSVEPTMIARVCIAISEIFEQHKFKALDVNHGNVKLIALVEAGATVEEFRDSAIAAMQSSPPKGFSWILGRVKNIRDEVLNTTYAKGAVKPKEDLSWRNDDNKILLKAQALKIHTQGRNKFELLAAIDSKVQEQRKTA